MIDPLHHTATAVIHLDLYHIPFAVTLEPLLHGGHKAKFVVTLPTAGRTADLERDRVAGFIAATGNTAGTA